MKKKLLLGVTLALIIVGCTTTQQTKLYNSLYTTEASVSAAIDSYDTLVIRGQLPTNDVPRVSHVFNLFQASFLVAVDAAKYNTNAITPPALAVEAQDVINLIQTIKAKGVK
jgi:hypothetical protein